MEWITPAELPDPTQSEIARKKGPRPGKQPQSSAPARAARTCPAPRLRLFASATARLIADRWCVRIGRPRPTLGLPRKLRAVSKTAPNADHGLESLEKIVRLWRRFPRHPHPPMSAPAALPASSSPSPTPEVPADQTPAIVRLIGLAVGLALFLLTFVVAPPDGMTVPAWRVCGLALWMAVWWITEAVALPVTALLPLVVLPLTNLMPLKKASANFAADLIFLFLGGFILSIAIQKWRVHERIGLGLMRYAAWNLPSLLAGLLLVTGFMGMWMSNTATAVVMMPMALSIAALITKGDTSSPVTKTLILAVAYAPCIGGLATFIGTPTNAVLEGYVSKTYGVNLSLAQWMSFGVPVAAVLLMGCWLLLYFTLLRGAPAVANLRPMMQSEYAKLADSRGARRSRR